MRILTVIGARPQFIKASPVSAALAPLAEEIIVNTGQHYDPGMSDVFFKDLGLKAPSYSLNVGSGPHGAQTAEILRRIEEVMMAEKPDFVVVYGDTNSTLGGALAAAKLQIPVAHVEAGLRSFNRAMPEEINRVVTDHLSTLLFVPSEGPVRQLQKEGITSGVHVTGDVMYDAIRQYAPIAATASRYPGLLQLQPRGFYLCTIHRAENTDSEDNLRQIFEGLNALPLPVVLPLHPRTKKMLAAFRLSAGSNVRIIDPVGYIDMLQLLQSSAVVLTDSGGLQKEAYYMGVPCVTLRSETEWTETVDAGWNRLAGLDKALIVEAVELSMSLPAQRPNLYGDGSAAAKIAKILVAAAHPDSR